MYFVSSPNSTLLVVTTHSVVVSTGTETLVLVEMPENFSFSSNSDSVVKTAHSVVAVSVVSKTSTAPTRSDAPAINAVGKFHATATAIVITKAIFFILTFFILTHLTSTHHRDHLNHLRNQPHE